MSYGFDRIADRKIAEAQEEGKFDDLEGKGKPLNLEDDPLTPPHLRMGNRILKNANVLPDWVQMDVDIRIARAECESLWERTRREYLRRKAAVDRDEVQAGRFADWYSRSWTGYYRALKQHNNAILKYNLAAPNSPTVYIPFRLEDEMERFNRAMPRPEGSQCEPPPARPGSSGMLRDSTTALYQAIQRKDEE